MDNLPSAPQALVDRFASGYSFDLDDFQRRGCLALASGRGTLVAAPTGAGKTVVGEHAVWLALRSGGKAFYTTPLKALSNQKFGDFVARHGAANVGLLTGDNSINGEAPVVVMTTEVLRNMLYEGSPTLDGLRYVVMDEVHYLQDRVRGAVWEEVLINLPVDVLVASLSATVSNAEEFGEWLEATRGATEVVIEERRPVPLDNYYLVGRELHPLFVTRGADVVPNPALARRGDREWRPGRDTKGRHAGRQRATGRGWVPSRVEVVDLLEAERLLPAIYFIFSRAGCDQAVEQCRAANVRLTSHAERTEILEFCDLKVAPIDPADLDALGYQAFAESLGHGVASHHAGMLPLFKEAVEELFAQGLVKVVFATETLSLGINMPARTVAIERLTKWQGERHELLTPGEYTQLTGRAGRRGIDSRGAAVVLHQPFLPFERITGLASTRTYPLTSSFRPSYNMAVNLVANYERKEAERLLASSFAQFLADRTVHGAEQTLARNARFLAGYRESAACDRGDVAAYWELRQQLRSRQGALADAERRADTQEAAELLRSLSAGTVIWLPGGRRRGLAAVIGPAGGRDGATGVLVLTEDRRVRRVAVRDLGGAPVRVGKVAMPRTLSPKSPRFKAYVARALAELDPPQVERPRRRRRAAADDPELQTLRAELAAHPVHGCPDLADHEKWLHRHDQLQRETDALAERVHRRTGSLVRTFDRVLDVLGRLGYVDGFALTGKGQTLRRVYAETDLVVVEALHRGVWRDLEPAELAACVSCLVYETRGSEGPPAEPPPPPTEAVRRALDALAGLQAEVHAHEEAEGLALTRPLDAGFADRAYRWATGEPLEEVLADEEVTPGDFVRVTKQLIDLLRQVALVAEEADLAAAARAAVDACQRGVVAYSGLL
ncbi:MAG TPA: DEAD/DEAH box helicase [Actinomycetota bacterium]|nr:DEAD/DEAH box helicase [Actinomycetota bacterium]